ncbi:SMI1/KNR4 family protein [Carnobacterium divergens]|uniref:SMI1/KNR4 family protein n=1 Tax=Carnobacterium divergens TaxID=2748 RepID=UPI0039B124CB
MFDNLQDNKKNIFYPVTLEEIEKVEKELKIKFPISLKTFYLEVGYGFIHSEVGNINRIMHPFSVRDFRLRQNDFEYYPDIEIYDEFEGNKLIFFEGNEASLLSVGFNSEEGKVFYYDEKLTDNFSDFIIKINKNDTFYYDSI